MKVTQKTFLRWANLLPDSVSDRNLMLHPVWLVPAPCCAVHCVNDGRYFTGDDVPEVENMLKERKNGFQFYQTEPPSGS